jgi:hypothetical protein
MLWQARFCYLGDFVSGRQYARHGLKIWLSGGVQSYAEDVHTPVVACLCYRTLTEWQHLGEIASCQANIDEAISNSKGAE